MDHEQFLVVEEEGGIYIFSGCSHKGVMSVIARAGELFAGKKILGSSPVCIFMFCLFRNRKK